MPDKTRYFAIDPGNIKSGYVLIDIFDEGVDIVKCGKIDNNELLIMLKDLSADKYVIEMISSYGMPVGKDVFETCVWIGRFIEVLRNVELVYRYEEKQYICNDLKAKDRNIRQALINAYAKHDFKNGKGTKKDPDVFYGVSNDVWSAIAVAVTSNLKEIGNKFEIIGRGQKIINGVEHTISFVEKQPSERQSWKGAMLNTFLGGKM